VRVASDISDTTLRLSIDAKATINIGAFCRGGKSRAEIKAYDHDFAPTAKVTPFGIFLPQSNQSHFYLTQSPVTSDFIVDCLYDFFNEAQERFPLVETLVINLDNGPQNHSRRTQFMKRITDFVDHFQISVLLAYYPPYHSKYNPIERVWGVFEQHINGSLMDNISTLIQFAKSMTYNARRPVVKFIETVYQTGVRLTKEAMQQLEKRFQRVEGLEKWFVRIEPNAS